MSQFNSFEEDVHNDHAKVIILNFVHSLFQFSVQDKDACKEHLLRYCYIPWSCHSSVKISEEENI